MILFSISNSQENNQVKNLLSNDVKDLQELLISSGILNDPIKTNPMKERCSFLFHCLGEKFLINTQNYNLYKLLFFFIENSNIDDKKDLANKLLEANKRNHENAEDEDKILKKIILLMFTKVVEILNEHVLKLPFEKIEEQILETMTNKVDKKDLYEKVDGILTTELNIILINTWQEASKQEKNNKKDSFFPIAIKLWIDLQYKINDMQEVTKSDHEQDPRIFDAYNLVLANLHESIKQQTNKAISKFTENKPQVLELKDGEPQAFSYKLATAFAGIAIVLTGYGVWSNTKKDSTASEGSSNLENTGDTEGAEF